MPIKSVLYVFISLLILCPLKGLTYEDSDRFESDGEFYTGSSTQTCSTCHTTNSTTDIFNVDPGDMIYNSDQGAFLFDTAQTYNFTISMLMPNDNPGSSEGQNGFTMEILDSNGNSAGELISDSSTTLSSDGDVIMDIDNPSSVATSWTFRWKAPASVTGALTIYFAGVDGDGDGVENSADKSDIGTVRLARQQIIENPKGGCGSIAAVSGARKYYTVPLVFLVFGVFLAFVLGYNFAADSDTADNTVDSDN